MEDEQYLLFKNFQAIHEYIYSQYVPIDEEHNIGVDVLVNDNHTREGLFLVQYSGLPFYLMTPWGRSCFCLTGELDGAEKIFEGILKKFGCRECKGIVKSPALKVFAILKNCEGKTLPEPGKGHLSQKEIDVWKSFAERYEEEKK